MHFFWFELISLILMVYLSFVPLSQALAALDFGFRGSLDAAEKKTIGAKLKELPITRKLLWSLLYPKNGPSPFDIELQQEIAGILEAAFIDGDTKVELMTPEIRAELGIGRGVLAMHKQGAMAFDILPSRQGSHSGPKQNDTIRSLKHPRYFKHEHNVFVADAEVSAEMNTLSLLLHELSHVAVDYWIVHNPEKVSRLVAAMNSGKKLKDLFYENEDGRYVIDGDAYDLLTERYAFELEYRLNFQLHKANSNWPLVLSFTEGPADNYEELVEDYVRRQYDIDHPALKKRQCQIALE